MTAPALAFGRVLADRLTETGRRHGITAEWVHSGGGVMVVSITCCRRLVGNRMTFGNGNGPIGWADEDGDEYGESTLDIELTSTRWNGADLSAAHTWCLTAILGQLESATPTRVPGTMLVYRTGAGEVTRMVFQPAEGDAGYFGFRNSDEFWEAASAWLTANAEHAFENDDITYPIGWEG